jgi:hypothetical protein
MRKTRTYTLESPARADKARSLLQYRPLISVSYNTAPLISVSDDTGPLISVSYNNTGRRGLSFKWRTGGNR